MRDWRNILILLLAVVAVVGLAAEDAMRVVRLKWGQTIRVEGPNGDWWVDVSEPKPGKIEILPHVPKQTGTRVERVPATTRADQ